MNRLVALLDCPSPRSFGMVPLVIETDGALKVTGLTAPSAHRGKAITRSDVEELIRSGHALPAPHMEIQGEIPSDAVALWLGDLFYDQVHVVQLFPPPLPAYKYELPEGSFFVGRPSELFVYLEQWVARAFDHFLRSGEDPERRAKIASLMQWALPGDPQTLAASWKAARDPIHELEWQLQTFGKEHAPADWKAKLEHVIESHTDPFASVRKIVAFTGGTGSHRSEVAEQFAMEMKRLSKLSVTYGSFRDPIEGQLRPDLLGLGQAAQKDLLMKVGQKAVEQSPLALTLSVPVLKPGLLTTPRLVVVDSVRHEAIKRVLEWLFGPERVRLVAVTADQRAVRDHIVQAGEDPDKIAADPTETEIEILTQLAHQRIRYEPNDWQENSRRTAEHFAMG